MFKITKSMKLKFYVTTSQVSYFIFLINCFIFIQLSNFSVRIIKKNIKKNSQNMQINEINWLHNKKSQLLKQIIDIETKSFRIALQQNSQRLKYEDELKTIQKQFSELKKKMQNEQLSNCRKQERLQNVILMKDKQIQAKFMQNDQIKANNDKLKVQNKQLKELLINKQNQLLTITQLNMAKFQQTSKGFTRELAKQQEKINQIIDKYQRLLQQKQNYYKQKHHEIVQDIRDQNELLFRQLQQKYTQKQSTIRKQKQQRKLEKEFNRVIQENKRLLQEINQYRVKLLTLQSELTNQRNHIKIKYKENQLKAQNYKKQIDFLKDLEARLNEKNKILLEKNQELIWQNKQVEFKFVEQVKRIKKISQKQIKDIIDKSEQQVAKLKIQIKNIKINELDTIKQENLSLKKKIQIFQKQLTEYKKIIDQKHNQLVDLKNQTEQLLKTKKQIQNVKQNNLKKCQQIQVLEDQIKRLKQKCNKLATALQQVHKNKQIMQKQNKMLLEQIIFLRDKGSKKRRQKPVSSNGQQSLNKSGSILNNDDHNVLEMKSQQSENFEDVDEYKQVIKQLDKGMQAALVKIEEKNQIIDKQKSMIAKMERIIAHGQ